MFEPVKVGFGEYLARWFKTLVVTTEPMREYVEERPLEKAIAFAPSRMVDKAEEMFLKYLRKDIYDRPTKPHDLPMVLVAVAQDYTPTGREYTRQTAEGNYVIIPQDEKQRVFRVKTLAGDIRAQIAIFASEEPTAKSLASQFCLFIDDFPNRRFMAEYEFAGFRVKYPVQLESTDSPAMNIQNDAKNLVILAVDLNLHCTVPIFEYPKEGEENDGKGTVGDKNDPCGYPLVSTLSVQSLTAEKISSGSETRDITA